MLPDKSVLLEQINAAIKKKWCKASYGIIDYTIAPESTINTAEVLDKNYIPFTKELVTFKKLEQRIESLENLNEQLFYFIDFLVENLPDLVIDIVQSDRDENSLMIREKGKEGMHAVSNETADPRLPCPTRREKDILELLEKGLCAKEIANRLFISETTVITHKKNLKEKFKARNTAELISKAHCSCSNTQP